MDKAIAIDPTNFEAIANKSSILAELGRYEESVKCSSQIPINNEIGMNTDEIQVNALIIFVYYFALNAGSA